MEDLSALRGTALPRTERSGPRRSALVLSTKRKINCMANARKSAATGDFRDVLNVFTGRLDVNYIRIL